MVYKISDRAIITQENGKTVLIAKQAIYEENLEVADTLGSLNSNYFDIYFADKYQGKVSGYVQGGISIPPYSNLNTIDKFSLTSNANATDVGNLTLGKTRSSAQKSPADGFNSGGVTGPGVNSPHITTIEKYSFSSDGNATSVGNLSNARSAVVGHSSATDGYSGAGYPGWGTTPTTNVIDKFPFAISSGTAVRVGYLTEQVALASGQQSDTHGYYSGGDNQFGANRNDIQKFPFVSDGNTTDVGDLTTAGYPAGAGHSSSDNGYRTGGFINPSPTFNRDTVDYWPFASDTNAVDLGDLSQERVQHAGVSSTTTGYVAGGYRGPAPQPNVGVTVIEAFPFAGTFSTSDTADLTQARAYGTGNQT